MTTAQDDAILRDVADMAEPDALSGSVSYRIRLLQIASYKSFEQKVTGFGAAPRYFGVLKLIEANPGIPQARLAEAIYLDRSSLVPIVETLGKEGWVERKASARDKRVRRLFLTKDGAERLKLLEEEVARHEAQLTAGLTERQKATLLTLLGKLDENLRNLHQGAG